MISTLVAAANVAVSTGVTPNSSDDIHRVIAAATAAPIAHDPEQPRHRARDAQQDQGECGWRHRLVVHLTQ
jgi:hypothetical protein